MNLDFSTKVVGMLPASFLVSFGLLSEASRPLIFLHLSEARELRPSAEMHWSDERSSPQGQKADRSARIVGE